MAKRVVVLLSGCGAGDGSDIHESLLTLLSIERSGARAICAAPAQPQAHVFDHLQNQAGTDPPRQALVEAARIARGQIQEIGTLKVEDFDALVIPGGAGVAEVLSNYSDKAQLCEVHPQVVRLLKAALSSHRPMGFVGLAAILAARVLGPVAGVRLTLPRAAAATKHAAVMGADVRPSALTDIFIDKKSRVISTGGFLHEEIQLQQVGQAIDKLVRTLVHLTRDRARPDPSLGPPLPAPRPTAARPAPTPAPPAPTPGQPIRRRATPGRGSV
jgi:enhancing lycopene biosynthesis protein 2